MCRRWLSSDHIYIVIISLVHSYWYRPKAPWLTPIACHCVSMNSAHQYVNCKLTRSVLLNVGVKLCTPQGWHLVHALCLFLFLKRLLTLSPATLDIHHQLRVSRRCMFQYITDGWCFPLFLELRPSPQLINRRTSRPPYGCDFVLSYEQ